MKFFTLLAIVSTTNFAAFTIRLSGFEYFLDRLLFIPFCLLTVVLVFPLAGISSLCVERCIGKFSSVSSLSLAVSLAIQICVAFVPSILRCQALDDSNIEIAVTCTFVTVLQAAILACIGKRSAYFLYMAIATPCLLIGSILGVVLGMVASQLG